MLLLLSAGAYLLPQIAPEDQVPDLLQLPTPSTNTALPGELPPETLALFEKKRPATVRVESLNARTGTGGIGTGFFINDAGQLLTAYHVVSGGQLFRVTTLSGRSYRAQVTAFDAAADVALLQVRGGGNFPYLNLATRAPRVRETVLAIGNSGGDFLQPRRGRLLRLNVAAGRADFPQGTLEMTAPLAPGDSGGPIIDGNGQAIGVVSYVRQDESGQTRTSYAVPVTEGNDLIAGLRAGEKRDTPVVGLVFDPTHSGLTDPPGAVVLRVAKGSPAERAGLRGCRADAEGKLTALGDAILSVNGVSTPSADAFITQVQRQPIGATVRLTFLRGDQRREVQLTLAARRSVQDLNDPSSDGPCLQP